MGRERYAAPSDLTSFADVIGLGFAVTEVFAARPDGTCSCRDGESCTSTGKHPTSKAFIARAVRERARPAFTIPAFVRLAPVTSYGVIPPKGSRLMIIDRDDDVPLPLPPTFEVFRASAPAYKRHFYYRLADDIDEAEVPKAFAGGEIAVAESRFCVGPGCRHKSGDLYESNGVPVGIADRELIDALSALKVVRRSARGDVEAVLGSRRAWLVTQARKFRGWSLDEAEIIERLEELNATVVEPPLTDREFADVIRGVEWAVKNVAPDRGFRITRRRNGRVSRRG